MKFQLRLKQSVKWKRSVQKKWSLLIYFRYIYSLVTLTGSAPYSFPTAGRQSSREPPSTMDLNTRSVYFFEK